MLIGLRIGSLLGPYFGVMAGDDSSGMPIPLVVMWGNSNIEGPGNANNVSSAREFGVDDPFTPVTLAALMASNSSDPPPFGAEFGPTPLVAYNPGTLPGFGAEITFGRQLAGISPNFGYLIKCGIVGSFLETHWLPTSTYMLASTGKNLYNTQRDRARAYEAATGRQAAIIFVELATNDASAAGPAGRVAANMTTMVAQLHADFPDAVIVWPLIHVGTVQTFTTTVRTQMLSFAATAPSYFMMPNVDHLSLQDIVHWDTGSCLTAGHIAAFAGADLLGLPRAAAVTGPIVAGHGVPMASNAASLTPLPWSGTMDRDTLLLFATGSGLTPGGGAATQTISTPAGWTPVTNGQTTAGGFTATWAVFSRHVAVGEIGTDTVPPSKDRRATAPTVTFANSTENVAKVVTVRGPTPGSQAVDISASTVLSAFGQGPFTIPALAPTVDNDLMIYFVGGEAFTTGDIATLTAAGLTGLAKYTETYHPMPDTGSNLLSIWTATLPVHGPGTGTAAVSFTLNTLAFVAAIGIKP